MTTLDFVYFDAGGGHRASATALSQVIQLQELPWSVRMLNLQEVLDPIDIIRKFVGVRIQDVYNIILRKGWTLGSQHLLKVLLAAIRLYHDQEVSLLRHHWKQDPPDLVVSFVPHFNRALREGLARTDPSIPFVTVLTDIADYPPHFWIEPQDQFFVCGSEKAAEQAKQIGIAENRIYRSSGMIIHPRFYKPVQVDRNEERRRLGLSPELPTGLVMFGGQGAKSMLEIADRIDASALEIQLILICGRNQELAERLRARRTRLVRLVEGFTNEIPYYMHLSDFFIGKPGPGSISEALAMKLPVIVQKNAWTLPQERYNAEWVREKQVGLVVKDFKNIASAVSELLMPENFDSLRANAAALENRAVLEIPAMLNRILEAVAQPL
jgi:UDP-N-acetylglucosamine:LPS N-acetylglucosamine transferase